MRPTGGTGQLLVGVYFRSLLFSPVSYAKITAWMALGVIGAIGLASTMTANVLDRIREFGIMHAIGARPKIVRRIIIAEGIFLAITSCLVAAIPAVALTKVLGIGLGNLFGTTAIPFAISWPAVGIWWTLVILGSAGHRGGSITCLTHHCPRGAYLSLNQPEIVC